MAQKDSASYEHDFQIKKLFDQKIACVRYDSKNLSTCKTFLR